MIQTIKIENFKVYKDLISFPLSNINILSGINGRGKSTLFQSMLLLRQSIEVDKKLSKIILNGTCVNLGNFDDIRNKAKEESINFIFNFDPHSSLNLVLNYNKTDEMVANVTKIEGEQNIDNFKNIHYVAADRVGPQEFYIKSTLPEFLNVGTKGEFIGNVLLQKKTELVYETLYIKEKNIENITTNLSQELETQTGEWLSRILGTQNIKIRAEDVGNRVIILSFLFGNSEKKYKPANVGFGYSYILPIVVSGLIAKKGEILIIENPEAHLHPKAQSLLINFLSDVSKCGVQIFIETHSEHILNAARLLVKNKNINEQDLSVLFFQDKKEEPFIKIEFNQNGGIDLWPEDFFDQAEKDMKHLLGF